FSSASTHGSTWYVFGIQEEDSTADALQLVPLFVDLEYRMVEPPPVPSAHVITMSPFLRSTLFAGIGDSLHIPQPESSGGQLGLVFVAIVAWAPKVTPPFVERR